MAKRFVWLLGIPCALLLVLYGVLLLTPIKIPFSANAIRSVVQSFVPSTAQLQMGDMSLALEGGVWPVLRFSPLDFSDSRTGAHISVEALEIGFSPARAIFGQPGTTVTIVRPEVQMVQDLYGPRPARMEVADGYDGRPASVKVEEGNESFTPAAIDADGIALDPKFGVPLRSDNDWLIYNLEAAEAALSDLVHQTELGRFSRLVVREGHVDMADTVYGLFRSFDDVSLDIAPVAGEKRTAGTFSATAGGRTVVGTVERSIDDDGVRRLQADITNLDFATILPFLDDPESIAALRGGGAVSVDVTFTPGDGKLIGGEFKLDLTGLDVRMGIDYFPVASSILDIDWQPKEGRFSLAEGTVQVGNSQALVSGSFALGLDPKFGPIMGMAIKARDVVLQPGDMQAPDAPFESIDYSGWSAPLYGALGIDRLMIHKGNGLLEGAGRIDALQAGLGIDLTLAGQDFSADDIKRLWPFVMGKESRDWFVANVPQGHITSGLAKFKFPVGSLGLEHFGEPLPRDSMDIEVTAEGVAVKPLPTLPAVTVAGETRLKVDGVSVSVAGGGGTLDTADGPVSVTNPTVLMDTSSAAQTVLELSGDVKASIPSILSLAQTQQPDAVANLSLPVDPASLTGDADVSVLATIGLPNEKTDSALSVDYVLNGKLADFASTQPIEGRKIAKGEFAFSASQKSYQFSGTAEIDGMPAALSAEGTPTTDPVVQLGADVPVADLKKFGFDASEYLSGQVRFLAKPLPGGGIQMSVDLEQAGVTLRDVGISKAVGTPGTLSTIVRFDGDVTHLENIALSFGSVRLNGKLDYNLKKGLVGASFDTFTVSEGDNASVSVTPIESGYAVRIRGKQLDLKPVLGRFFGLNQGSGGVQSTQFDDTIALDVQLDRAIGYYATTAFNLSLNLTLRGSNLSRAQLSAQFSEGNAISITTNPAPKGRTLTVAFNDAGTVLRLLGIYSQLAGGSGSLVMTTDRELGAEAGQLIMHNFAIVDEEKVVEVLGNHKDSRAAISANNRLDFRAGQLEFTRRTDRIEVTDAVLAGDTVGGTLRGVIYTKQRQYDLSGTYVPLFGINNVFQQIPVLGPLLGGRNGEGLVGVTFAVRGPLDRPEFLVNPLSILAPGFLRELFEFRAKELPTQ